MLKIYTYANCDTCRRALKWLRAHRIDCEEIPIRETPPSPGEARLLALGLRAERVSDLEALAAHDGVLRRLFNTSGRDYRELKLGDRLPAMSAPEAIALLRGNGNLVKRPFLIGRGVAQVGFDEAVWAGVLK